MKKVFLLSFLAMAVASCGGGSSLGSALPRGTMAYNVIPLKSASQPADDYRIGPLDGLDITVLQEPELSPKAIPVDAFGNVNLPLVGDVKAGGKTASELAKEVAAKYGQRYLKNPQVSVVVSKPVAQKVVIQGEVVQPGIYPIDGPTTLLGAISLAKGETQVAALNEVAVFRTVNGQRMGALFDVRSIRSGQAADPEIRTNDLVVVGYSASRRMWRDVISSVPILNIFRPF